MVPSVAGTTTSPSMIAEPALIKKASLAIFAKRSAQQNVVTKTQHNPRTRTEIQNDGPGRRGTGTVFGSAPVYTGSIHRPEAFIKSLEGQFVPLNLIRSWESGERLSRVTSPRQHDASRFGNFS